MKIPMFVKILFVLVLASALFFFRWQSLNARQDAKNAELVESIALNGHQYQLYFHREGAFYNTIKKDDIVIFDGRDNESLRSCIQQLVVKKSIIYRRCYHADEKKVLLVPLP